MIMNSLTCPRHDVLVAYQTGELTETSAESVTSHVSACPPCQAELKTIRDTEDTFVNRLRASLAEEEPFLAEPGCATAVAQAQAAVGSLARTAASAATVDSAPPDLGQLGEYKLLEKLGEGGMGAVYKAQHTKLDKLVALKVLPKDRMQDPRAVGRFEREMKAVGRLNHLHIVQAHDAREIDGTHFLAMEYVEGLDLSKLISATGALRVADACELVRQAAVGLQHAHEQGLVHRDIKPSNLMLNGQETVKILDLGLALLGVNQPNHPEMTAAGTAMGTADYVSPEQVTDSHSVDIRSDIYSLGCTLYKLLSGRAPYVGPEFKNDVTKMMAHVDKTPPPISLLRTDLSRELATVVERMMAKDPAQRYATPAEVAAALAPFAVGADLRRLMAEAMQIMTPDASTAAPTSHTEHASGSPVADTATSHPKVTQPGTSSHVPQLQPAPERGWPPRSIRIGLAAAAAAILLLFGIWVIVHDKSGREVARIQVPDGGSATFERTTDSRDALPSRWQLPPGVPPPAIAPFDAAKAKEHQAAWAKYLGVQVEMENSIGMRFVLIPPGEFDMGTTEAEQAWALERAKHEDWALGRIPPEGPRHRVRITKPFWIGMREVTQGEYEQVIGRNPSDFSVLGREKDKVAGQDTSHHPVEMVSWDDARDFCLRLSGLAEEREERRLYWLPTEAQWEYACRAGTPSRWSWGDEEQYLPNYAWVSCGQPHPVGSKIPNAWGLHDMHGNQWEWCNDWYDAMYYKTSPADDPPGAPEGSTRVLRGGSWQYPAVGCRSAYRYSAGPGSNGSNLGLRLSMLLADKSGERTEP
jgi:serine/threonine protein kinase/formylglycine-generating enzyme required for sulfatase activity